MQGLQGQAKPTQADLDRDGTQKRQGVEEVISTTVNTRRAIVSLLFAVGLILLIVGATTSAYSTITGVIIFLCFLFGGGALERWWSLKRKKTEGP